MSFTIFYELVVFSSFLVTLSIGREVPFREIGWNYLVEMIFFICLNKLEYKEIIVTGQVRK
jgi:hypothetical protein